MSKNLVILIGRLTRDPEVRYTQSGTAVASFSLAVGREKQQPDAPDSADYISIVAWGSTAEACGNNLAKGDQVCVNGRLQSRSYIANDGQKRYVTEVVVDNVAPNIYASSRNKAASPPKTAPTNGSADFDQFGSDVIDEPIPF